MHPEILEIDLGNDRMARLVICIIEEPLPTPNEIPHRRCPSAGELETIAAELQARRYTITSP